MLIFFALLADYLALVWLVPFSVPVSILMLVGAFFVWYLLYQMEESSQKFWAVINFMLLFAIVGKVISA